MSSSSAVPIELFFVIAILAVYAAAEFYTLRRDRRRGMRKGSRD